MKSDIGRETKIWRYMSIAKFVSMLHTQSIFFARPMTFLDKWDCLTPPYMQQQILSTLMDDGSLAEFSTVLERENAMRRYGYFVSCWHIGETESDAMWRLYGLSPEGVAIQTTVGKVNDCLHPKGYGEVVYYDPASCTELPTGNPLRIKRKHFEHEREFRAWFSDDDVTEKIDRGETVKLSELSAGQYASIEDLSKFIEAIVLAPGCGQWIWDSIVGVCENFNRRYLVSRLRRSSSDHDYEELIKQIKDQISSSFPSGRPGG